MKIKGILASFRKRIVNDYRHFFFLFILFILAFIYLFERIYFMMLKMELTRLTEILNSEKVKTTRLEYKLNELTSPERLDILSHKLAISDPLPQDIYVLKDPIRKEENKEGYALFRNAKEFLGFIARGKESAMR